MGRRIVLRLFVIHTMAPSTLCQSFKARVCFRIEFEPFKNTQHESDVLAQVVIRLLPLRFAPIVYLRPNQFLQLLEIRHVASLPSPASKQKVRSLAWRHVHLDLQLEVQGSPSFLSMP